MQDDIMTDDELDELEGGSDGQLYEHFRIEVDKGQKPVRIDKYLAECLQHSSRNRIQKAADAGYIYVGGQPVKSNYKVRPLDVVTLMLNRPPHDNTIEAEDIPLDIVYEDDDVMVVNKPRRAGGASRSRKLSRHAHQCRGLASARPERF